jgi:hypothetical protein
MVSCPETLTRFLRALSIHLLLQRRPSRSRRIALAYTYFMLVVTILWCVVRAWVVGSFLTSERGRYAFSAKTTEAQILESSETDYCARDNIIGTVFSTLQFIGSDALLVSRETCISLPLLTRRLALPGVHHFQPKPARCRFPCGGIPGFSRCDSCEVPRDSADVLLS